MSASVEGGVLPALVIEHVGSTAVAGLVAKPILDILAGHPRALQADVYFRMLAALGYEAKGEQGVPGRELFVLVPANARIHHLHLVALGSRSWREPLAFRDRLRAEPALASAYGALKLGLAASHADDRQAYTSLHRRGDSEPCDSRPGDRDDRLTRRSAGRRLAPRSPARPAGLRSPEPVSRAPASTPRDADTRGLTMRIGREFHIDSSHQLEGHPKCGRLHGHTYRIEVVLEGPEDARGMVLDFADFRQAVEAYLEHLDHAHLNDFVDVPTVENLARHVLRGLRERLPQVVQVRVWEGLRKFAEYSEPLG